MLLREVPPAVRKTHRGRVIVPSRDRSADRRKVVREPASGRRAADARLAVEAMMDETLDESFPASDPPAWGSAAARVRRIKESVG
jgi:hypothetical protein